MGGVSRLPARRGRSFVGRAVPLAIIDRAVAESLAGRPHAVLVEGEAGIGKSRLVAEAIASARRRGAMVLVGHCREGLDVPYLPLANALAPLGDELGPAIELLDLDSARPSDPLTTVHERLAAPLVAACRAAVQAARRRPVVLLVEDLHWADRPTADLFEQLVTAALDAGTSASTALAVVTTFRRPEGHVARVVERLRRESATRSVRLDAMDEFEVNELLTSLGPEPPSRRLLAEMVTATRGNPLLVGTLLTRLLETGGVEVRDGRLDSSVAELDLLCGGLDDELLRRLAPISRAGRDLLTRAAFLGDGGLLADLESTTSASPDDFEQALDEVESASLLHDDGDRYRFDHPQLCQVVYRLPEGRARRRLHLQLADQLEARYGSDGQRAAEIADHLRHGGPDVDGSRLARWSLLAGQQAFAVAAWGTAARRFDVALDTDPPSDPATRARLAFQAGLGHFRDHDLPAAERRLREAIESARTAGDVELATRAALLLTRGRNTIGTASVGALIDTTELEEAMAADPDPARTGEATALLAEVRFHAFDFDAGVTLLEEARRCADETGDHSLGAGVELGIGLQLLGRLDLAGALDAFRGSAAHADQLPDPWQRVWGLGRLPLAEISQARLTEAAEHAAAAAGLAAANHDWAELALASACTMQVHVARGEFGSAEDAGTLAARMYRRSDYAFVPALMFPALAAARALRGDATGAIEALDDWAAAGGLGLAPYRLLVAASTLQPDAFSAERPFRAIGTRPVNLFTLPVLCAQVEVGLASGHRELLADAYPALVAQHAAGVRWCLGWPLLVSRLLAATDRYLGRLTAAERWCDIAAAEAHESPAESARVVFERAQIARLAGDMEASAALAADAAGVFDRLGMIPSLQAAVRLGPVGTSPIERTILFTDIVGSTELNVRRGDAAYLELLERHNAILRGELRRFDGVEIKHTGDGLAAWFTSAPAACESALAIGHALGEHNERHPESSLSLRFGLARGSPIPHEGDLFGLVMSLAARLCDRAAAGQVLASSEVVSAAAGGRARFRSLEPVSLKGFPEPIAVYEVMASR